MPTPQMELPEGAPLRVFTELRNTFNRHTSENSYDAVYVAYWADGRTWEFHTFPRGWEHLAGGILTLDKLAELNRGAAGRADDAMHNMEPLERESSTLEKVA